MRRSLLSILILSLTVLASAQDLRLPNKPGSVHFAVIGDTGTGDKNQVAVARQMVNFRNRFTFPFVIMVGDNIYGSDKAKDFEKKFSTPYKPMLDAGVKFYAALGNHDDPNQRFFKPFNMNGERYYTFKPADGIRLFALDSNYMDDKQMQWLEKELAASGSDWKIAFFHHPLYSSGGTHGSATVLRDQIEPLFVKHGVNAVFTGHEHFYERITPQKGIAYFVSGSSAKLRAGDIGESPLKAVGFDQGYTFMLVEIDGDNLHYQTITDKGQTIDAGTIRKSPDSNRVIGTTGGGRRGGTSPTQ